MSGAFTAYDTAYTEDNQYKYYPIEKDTEYILLIFRYNEGNQELFTTLRKYDTDKWNKYQQLIGITFDVVIEDEVVGKVWKASVASRGFTNPKILAKIEDKFEDYNPCMKCGSVQCAVCSEDLDKHFIEKEKVKKAWSKFNKDRMKYTLGYAERIFEEELGL